MALAKVKFFDERTDGIVGKHYTELVDPILCNIIS